MKTCCQTSKNEISNVKNVYQVGYVGNADPIVGDRSEVVAYQIRTEYRFTYWQVTLFYIKSIEKKHHNKIILNKRIYEK